MARPRVLLGVAGAALAVFAVLLVAVAVHRGPLPFDAAARAWVEANATAEGRNLVLPLARMGAREVLVPLLLAGGVALWWRRGSPGPLLLLVGSYLGMAMMVAPAKRLLERPEPLDLPGEIGRSFPSGHAAQAVLVYGLLAALVAVDPAARRARPVLVAVPVVCSALVGVAMLYRNAHWVSDMVAGYAIGLAWAVGPLALARLAAPRRLGLSPDDPTGPAPEAAGRRR